MDEVTTLPDGSRSLAARPLQLACGRGVLTQGLLGAAQVAAVACVLAAVAFALGGRSGIDQATNWLVFGLFAISVDVLWGYCGLLSFGQAAFFGLGAFSYTWMTTNQVGLLVSWNASVAGLGFAIVLAAAVAAVLGYFLFYGKVTGAYFTIVMLALSFLMQSLGQGESTLFGGYTGIANVPAIRVEVGPWNLGTGGPIAGFVFVAAVIAVVVVLLRWMLSTPLGLAVDGVRGNNEMRSTYLGSRTVSTKLLVFVVSAALAGLAGALYASQANYVTSDLMGTAVSTQAVIWVAVGGRRTLIGPLIGAVVVEGVGYWLSSILVDYWSLLLGLLFIAVVLGGSSGLMGLGRWALAKGVRVAARNH